LTEEQPREKLSSSSSFLADLSLFLYTRICRMLCGWIYACVQTANYGVTAISNDSYVVKGSPRIISKISLGFSLLCINYLIGYHDSATFQEME